MLAVIPARGGSKGILNKNLRLLHGKPLFLHIADTLRSVPDITMIVVSTESAEIAAVARLHGFEVIDRPAELATDDVPIAPVIAHAVQQLGWSGEVGVFQPTVPCLSPETVWAGIAEFRRGSWDSLGFVSRERHLLWDANGPLYETRANRQFTGGYDRELGAFLCRSVPLTVVPSSGLIGARHCRFPVPEHEAVDIDTHADLETARHLLGRKTIEFRAAANDQIGTGHLRRCMQLAEELSHHDIRFKWSSGWPGWASELISGRGWEHRSTPDLVVFDKLDTTIEEVAKVRAEGIPVVSLEDLGAGSEYACLVINELYKDTRPHVLSGPKWSVLRPEFCGLPPYQVREKSDDTLVVFGGTDPAGLTAPISLLCQRAGRAFNLKPGQSVAEAMRAVDLVVCSAGRMAHEAAAVGAPCVTIAVNERESRHSHCPGVVRLGLWATLTEDEVQETVYRLHCSPELREEMSVTARRSVDGLGGRRIARKIDDLLESL